MQRNNNSELDWSRLDLGGHDPKKTEIGDSWFHSVIIPLFVAALLLAATGCVWFLMHYAFLFVSPGC